MKKPPQYDPTLADHERHLNQIMVCFFFGANIYLDLVFSPTKIFKKFLKNYSENFQKIIKKNFDNKSIISLCPPYSN
jgi:hypothetical protein